MEIFNIDILKKEFERFQKENLVEILKCRYCQKTACESWHNKFLVSCKYCREAFFQACHNFNIAKETLTKSVDSVAKDYIEDFIKDFLCISNQTLEKNVQVSEVVRVPVDKTFNVKSYHKSDKNRTEVVYKKFDNCEKLWYTIKGKPRTFYEKSQVTLDYKNELV